MVGTTRVWCSPNETVEHGIQLTSASGSKDRRWSWSTPDSASDLRHGAATIILTANTYTGVLPEYSRTAAEKAASLIAGK
jgi:hypothetical protein